MRCEVVTSVLAEGQKNAVAGVFQREDDREG